MKLEALAVGPLQANCYLVGCADGREGLVIDPGGDAPVILRAIERAGLEPQVILNTHGHVDHTAANRAVREATGARLYIHQADVPMIERPDAEWAALVGGAEPSGADATYAEGEVLEVGSLAVRVVHTPGHSPGSVCLSLGEVLFTGDTLFAGGVGRTDLPGGSWEELEASLRRLVEEFEPATRILPGHGPSSTLEQERRSNPWLREL
jgi:hydroxyacylglutathione hydrolase